MELLTDRFEQIFTALWAVSAGALLFSGYYFLRFTWKLQDAFNRKLIPPYLMKSRMGLEWMFTVGDIVPGTAHYRRRCKGALVIALAAFMALAVISHIRPL